VRRIIAWWALLGGFLLLGVVLVTAWSLVRDIIWSTPVPGENEIVQVGIAVAVFAFLPYCQITGANISADIFTSGLGARGIAVFTLIGSLVALAFAGILVWRTWDGLLDYQELLETTPIMQFPIWYSFVPILISIALLVVAAAISVYDAFDDFRTGRSHAPALH
jgi:TRAP-type C4-dicarboxylate transport system permease small subunit